MNHKLLVDLYKKLNNFNDIIIIKSEYIRTINLCTNINHRRYRRLHSSFHFLFENELIIKLSNIRLMIFDTIKSKFRYCFNITTLANSIKNIDESIRVKKKRK